MHDPDRNLPDPGDDIADPGVAACLHHLDGYTLESLIAAHPEVVDALADHAGIPGLKRAVDAARDNAQ